MTQGELFAGIGGFGLAGRWAGIEPVFQVEWNPFCQKVLKKNFPDAQLFGDIREFDGTPFAGKIDIISGGFPCQPFSHAGKRKGTSDDRFLWPQMLRVVREVGPTWVVGENVVGITTMDSGRVFNKILADLEDSGYSTEAFIIPAVGVGAPHRRDRVWIIAHSNSKRECAGLGGVQNKDEEIQQRNNHSEFIDTGSKPFSYAHRNGLEGHRQYGKCAGQLPFGSEGWRRHWLNVVTELCRVDDGVSQGVDGCLKSNFQQRIKSLGNAIVPQIAYIIFETIRQYEQI